MPGVLSGNKDIKQVCLIGKESESGRAFDICFASLAHMEKPGNQPQQLSDNDNSTDGLTENLRGTANPPRTCRVQEACSSLDI